MSPSFVIIIIIRQKSMNNNHIPHPHFELQLGDMHQLVHTGSIPGPTLEGRRYGWCSSPWSPRWGMFSPDLPWAPRTKPSLETTD